MSQILVPRRSIGNTALLQDLYFSKKKASLKSSVKEVTCIICDKTLEDGVSVTAKKMGQKLRFFCQYHLPKDY